MLGFFGCRRSVNVPVPASAAPARNNSIVKPNVQSIAQAAAQPAAQPIAQPVARPAAQQPVAQPPSLQLAKPVTPEPIADHILAKYPNRAKDIEDFFLRLELTLEQFRKAPIAQELEEKCGKNALIKLYEHLLSNKAFLTSHLAKLPAVRAIKQPYQFRTVNFVPDKNGQLLLFVESKSKLASG